jgi:hypothetical protein
MSTFEFPVAWRNRFTGRLRDAHWRTWLALLEARVEAAPEDAVAQLVAGLAHEGYGHLADAVLGKDVP